MRAVLGNKIQENQKSYFWDVGHNVGMGLGEIGCVDVKF